MRSFAPLRAGHQTQQIPVKAPRSLVFIQLLNRVFLVFGKTPSTVGARS